MIVDAEGKVLGRVCSFAAKQALLGENVIIINAEKAVISGDADMVYGKELRKLEIKNVGNPQHGPFHQKRPDKFVRKAVRGMLPWHKFRGREAFKRVMVYMGAPVDEIKKNHNVDLKQTEITNVPAAKKKVKGVTVLQVCKTIGGAK
jgi:large subunit ribosomal protein L13